MNKKDLKDIADLGKTQRQLVNIYREEPSTVLRNEIAETIKKLTRMMFSIVRGKR